MSSTGDNIGCSKFRTLFLFDVCYDTSDSPILEEGYLPAEPAIKTIQKDDPLYWMFSLGNQLNSQFLKYPDFIEDQELARIVFHNIVGDLSVNFEFSNCSIFVTEQNSIYFKLLTIEGFQIRMEVFLDSQELFYTVKVGSDLIEEDVDEYKNAIQRISDLKKRSDSFSGESLIEEETIIATI